MQLGLIGLGRMGTGIAQRLHQAGHRCAVYDRDPKAVERLSAQGAQGCQSIDELIGALEAPRAIWLMIPAALVDEVLTQLAPLLAPGDIVIDGGNSYYRDDIARATKLEPLGVHFVDVGTSGGIAGIGRGFCLMIGGEASIVTRLEPIFSALAAGEGAASATPGRPPGRGGAERGFFHCGPHGAGHFVKMIHNGIEYGLMAAYAEGLNILRHADIGRREHVRDAETSPVRDPQFYQYQFDLAEISELWRRGSVISSWLLDLTAAALVRDPGLTDFAGRVSDSGEGRWTLLAAIDEAVPAPALSAALYERFSSRGEADFANRVLSAMRQEFGGHHEIAKPDSA